MLAAAVLLPTDTQNPSSGCTTHPDELPKLRWMGPCLGGASAAGSLSPCACCKLYLEQMPDGYTNKRLPVDGPTIVTHGFKDLACVGWDG